MSEDRTIFQASSQAVEVVKDYPMKRGLTFGAIIVVALLAFELFNYTTTDFALTSLLGDVRFAGLRWGTILALAFCGIDFAGIARLFTPQREPVVTQVEVWYLLGAWFLAATMNAMLTWWGISLALLNHSGLGNEILSREELISGVPVFVSVLVWLIRILLIGTFTMAGDRLFTQAMDATRRAAARTPAAPEVSYHTVGDERRVPAQPMAATRPIRPVPKPSPSFSGDARPIQPRREPGPRQ